MASRSGYRGVFTSVVGVCLIAVSLGTSSTAAAASALTLSVSPGSGPPGTIVTVTGGGFDPHSGVDIYLDSTDVALAASNAVGSVSFHVTVPRSTQPGMHWVTLMETRTQVVQSTFTVMVNWPQSGWGPSARYFNPFENTINPGNADQLAVAWSRHLRTTFDEKPFVVFNGNAYVLDEAGTLRAISPTGSVLWTATGFPAHTPQFQPAAAGGKVFVAAGSSVAALDYRCRTDGGVCAKRLWRTAIGAQVSAGLTLRDGVVFVPGADGKVHVLSASNGALHASITPHYGTGPVTQPVSFAPDGTIYIVQDNHFYATGPDGSFDYGSGGALQTMSQMAVGNARAFATDEVSEIVLAYLYVPGLSNPIDPACVQTPRPPVQPVAAPDVVFFAFCSLFGAYDPETLLPRWTAPGYASGMALAGGVLYVCKGERVVAFDARDGRLLGSSAPCEGSPEVANGTVFSTRFSLYATTLDGVDNTVSGARPDPSGLRPAPRVHGRSH